MSPDVHGPVEETPLPAGTANVPPVHADDGAADGTLEAAAAEQPAPRATWSSRSPDEPWCADSWRPHLDALGVDCRPPIDVVGQRLRTDAWDIVAAARRGRQHAHRGEHREDAIAVRRTASGWCGAVADGAGSAPFSRVGAAVATQTFCAAFEAHSGALGARATAAAEAVHATMRQLAETFQLPTRAFRTTLLAVAVDGNDLATMQVGDGGLVVLMDDGRTVLPQAGDAGEFSGEVHHFLPDAGSLERLVASLHLTPLTGARAVLLATDGVEDPWYPLARHATLLAEGLDAGISDDLGARTQGTNGVQISWRGAVCHAPDPAAALGEWLTFEKRGENDDRALLVARLLRP